MRIAPRGPTIRPERQIDRTFAQPEDEIGGSRRSRATSGAGETGGAASARIGAPPDLLGPVA